MELLHQEARTIIVGVHEESNSIGHLSQKNKYDNQVLGGIATLYLTPIDAIQTKDN
jgi:hypothetical protein